MSPNDVNHWIPGSCSRSDYKGPFDPEEYPLGCKFDPSDVELLGHLAKQVNPKDDKPAHKNIGTYIVTLENLCQVHPDELPGMTKDGYARHFFYPPTKTYNVGEKRKVAIGLDSKSSRAGWCKSGKTLIVNDLNKKQIGCKKIFVLHNRKSKKRKGTFGNGREDEETKTQWVLHQLQLGSEEEEHAYVVCKVIWQLKPRTMKHGHAEQEQEDEPEVETEFQLSDPPLPPPYQHHPDPKTELALPASDQPHTRNDKSGFVSADIPVVGGMRKEGSAFRVLPSSKGMRPITQPWPFQGLAPIPAGGMVGVGMVSYTGVPIQSVAGKKGVWPPYVHAMQVQNFDTVVGKGRPTAKTALQSGMRMGMGMGMGMGVGAGMGASQPISLQGQCGDGYHPRVSDQISGGGKANPAHPSHAGEDQRRLDSSPEVVDCAEEMDCSEPEDVVVTSQGLTAMLMCSETPPECMGGLEEEEEQERLGVKPLQRKEGRGHSEAQHNSGLQITAAGHLESNRNFESKDDILFSRNGGGETQGREGWREDAGGGDGGGGREGGVEGRDSFHIDTFLRSTPDSGPSQPPPTYDVVPIASNEGLIRPQNGIPNVCTDQREGLGVQSQLGVSKKNLPDSEEIQKYMREELDRIPHPLSSTLHSLDVLAQAGEEVEMGKESAMQVKPEQKRLKPVADNRNGGRGEERKNRSSRSSLTSLLTR